MRARTILTTALFVLASGAATLQAAAKVAPKAKVSAAQLQAQITRLTAERDDLKQRITAAEGLQEDLAAAQKSRDLARQEAEASRKELDQMKNSLAENQGSADTILKDLKKAKDDLAACQGSNESLRTELAAAKVRKANPVGEGSLVVLARDVTPALPMNLNRVTPKVRKVSRGVVVVNVLVGENGEVLDSRLLQGLPGKGEWIDKANDACVESAKRLVFDPARAADGKTKVRVWQGVGFMVD
jgi:predicted  nucleic acid-binding Zn-ribbon protein